MDYSTMSDPEINSLVYEEKEAFDSYGANIPDYCNNPSDAWPIIVENLINISVLPAAHLDNVLWVANYGSDAFNLNKNPLRAAMIVYLMMEGE